MIRKILITLSILSLFTTSVLALDTLYFKESFGSEVDVEGITYFWKKGFGAQVSVQVTSPEYILSTETFGVIVTVTSAQWSNWSGWWVIEMIVESEPVGAPYVTIPSPANASIDVPKSLASCSAYISHSLASPLTGYINCSNGDTMTFTAQPNGTQTLPLTTPLTFNTLYRWYVNVTDGVNWARKYYWFVTAPMGIPSVTLPNPANESLNISIYKAYWSAYISHPDGLLMNGTIDMSNGQSINFTNISDSTQKITISSKLEYDTTYTVRVNVSDDTNTVERTFWFTTDSLPGARDSLFDTNGTRFEPIILFSHIRGILGGLEYVFALIFGLIALIIWRFDGLGYGLSAYLIFVGVFGVLVLEQLSILFGIMLAIGIGAILYRLYESRK